MTRLDPGHIAALVHELHGYFLDAAGAVRAADMVAGISAALEALAAEPRFHEEPANFAVTLVALAPEGD
jgi:hypothetical protein